MNEKTRAILDEVKRVEQARKQLVEKLRVDFKDMFKPYLEKYPQVKELAWTQYTPYYNDGDPCVFRVHDLGVYLGVDSEDEYDGSFYYDACYEDPDVIVAFGEEALAYAAFQDFLVLNEDFRSFPDDVLEGAFGDHARIRVTKEGINIEEYQHD